MFAPAGESPVAYARRLVRERHYSPAIQVCRAGLKDGPPSAELHEVLGRALLLSGDAKGSLWHFLQLTLLLPEQAVGYVNLGAAYSQLEKYTQAIEVLAKAVKLNPTAAAYHNLGLAHRNLKNLPSAKTAFRETLRLNPNLAEAHENLASVYVELGDFTLAITHYQKALELRPGYAKAREGLGTATLALSRPRVESPEPERVPISPPLNSAASSGLPPIDSPRARYLGRDIARAANDLRQHFENTIIPLLNHMHRLLIEGRGDSYTFREQQQEYRSACQQNSDLRKTLRLLCVRLFATDELARTSSR
jgi:tetratricopeptide (TPR) repeat protein